MRFLLDQNRSPRLAVLLRQAGHDAVHTLDLGLAEAGDDEVLAVADEQGRVLVSGDTDFGALLALLHRTSPSVVLFRARNLPQAPEQAAVLLEHLDELGDDLQQGAVVWSATTASGYAGCRCCMSSNRHAAGAREATEGAPGSTSRQGCWSEGPGMPRPVRTESATSPKWTRSDESGRRASALVRVDATF